jgi:hypothetical protein
MEGTYTHRKGHLALNIIFGIILFLAIVRIVLPGIMKTVANNRLEKESPYFAFHIDDIDLHIIKGKYLVKGISGTMKETGEKFLSIAAVETDVPWKAIFNGKVAADVIVNAMKLSASQELLDKAKQEMERVKQKYASTEKKEESKESKFALERFSLFNSQVTIHDFMSFKGKDVRSVDNINVIARNLTPTENRPTTEFGMTADVFGPAPLKVVGEAKLKDQPLSWDVNAILKNFDLRSVSPIAQEKAQVLIHKGKMDLYAEAKSKNDVIQGYAKPFVSKLRMDTPPGGFKFTGATAATGGNLVKLLLTDSESKSLSTVAPFTYTMKDKALDIDVIPILQKAVVHRAKQNIQPGLMDNIGKPGLGVVEETKQAEEAPK